MVGTLHAWLITCVGLPPFIATLATLVGLRSFSRGLTQAVTNNKSQIDFPDLRCGTSIKECDKCFNCVYHARAGRLVSDESHRARPTSARNGRQRTGRKAQWYSDRSPEMAGVCARLGGSSMVGIVYFADTGSAKPDILARGYELNAIAASVIGGCSLQGGVGTIFGTVLGCLFLERSSTRLTR